MNNNTEYLNNENPEDIFIKSSSSFTDVISNMSSYDEENEIANLKTVDDFNFYHLSRIKKYNFKNNIFGIVHIQLKYFQKKNNYDAILKIVDQKIQTALNISKTHTGVNKLFVLLDLSNITQRNYSKKFMKLLAKEFNKKYDDCIALCYVCGNFTFVKLLWPFITTLIENKTKKKLVLLK